MLDNFDLKSIGQRRPARSHERGVDKILRYTMNLLAPDEHDEITEDIDQRTPEQIYQDEEFAKCSQSIEYFINEYCRILDTETKKGEGVWIPFKLWEGARGAPGQTDALKTIMENQLSVILKARQNGLTWLALAIALWLCIFRPIASILLFSLRDDEAVAMLGTEKLGGMRAQLPEWLRPELITKAKHQWSFINGSVIRALPTTAGDSYTATLAVVDEADLIPNLNELLQRVKPTIDAGGKLVLISRSNKKKPRSLFKEIYRKAAAKLNDYASIFLPWFARPSRTDAWYEKEKSNEMANTTALDNLYESYPATDVEALAPSTLDKRLPYTLLKPCYLESTTLMLKLGAPITVPLIPTLRIYEWPIIGVQYVGGADPAEGNPTSDDSAFVILNKSTGKQVAVINGKFEPATFADYIQKLAKFYNNAAVLVERNNHGHAVIMACGLLRVKLFESEDKKLGYLSNSRTKTILYDKFAESVQTADIIITDAETFNQLVLIEGNTLSAPEGENDDLADAIALANFARSMRYFGKDQSALSFGTAKGW